MNKTDLKVQETLQSIVEGIQDVKGEKIKIINLNTINQSEYGYFVICEGNSNTQVSAIADSVEKVVEQNTGERVLRTEGKQNSLWVLLDYGDIIVHIFQKEIRTFYNLEGLWADAEIEEIVDEN